MTAGRQARRPVVGRGRSLATPTSGGDGGGGCPGKPEMRHRTSAGAATGQLTAMPTAGWCFTGECLTYLDFPGEGPAPFRGGEEKNFRRRGGDRKGLQKGHPR